MCSLAGRCVLFAVPAAFSPTCSQTHLPGYVKHHDAIKAGGVDEIVCVSANDVWVLDAWAEQGGAKGKVLMLSDGNLEFTRAAGMELDATVVGEGFRSQRYAARVEDGVVTEIKVDEKPWLAEASSADVDLPPLAARGASALALLGWRCLLLALLRRRFLPSGSGSVSTMRSDSRATAIA